MTAHAITLPGPAVTRAVSWEQVRAYLTAEGWEHRAQESGMELWQPVASEPGAIGTPTAWIKDYSDAYDVEPEIGTTIRRLARLAFVSPGEMLARIAGEPIVATPEDLGAIMTACRNRGAEDMRERCASIAESNFGAVAGAYFRALPIPGADPFPPPVCACPDRLAAGTPTQALDGWYMLAHVERAYAETHGSTPVVDRDGDDNAVNVRVRFCPFCGRAPGEKV